MTTPITPPVTTAMTSPVSRLGRFQKSRLSLLGSIPAIIVLISAMLGIDVSQTIFAHLPSMVPLTASCLLLTAISNVCMRSESRNPLRVIPAILVSGIGAALLISYLANHFIGNLQVQLSSISMSPESSLSLLAISLSHILYLNKNYKASPLLRTGFQILNMSALVVCLLAGLGYIYAITGLFGLSEYIGMSVLTAVSLIFFICDSVSLDPGYGLIRALTRQTTAAIFLRKFVLSGLVAPFLMAGVIRSLEVYHHVNSNYGMAAFVFFTVICILSLGTFTATSLDRIELQNVSLARKEIEIRDANEAGHLREKFLANMSHEVRTPLTAIMGYLDFIDDSGLSVTDRLAFTGRAKRSARTLVRILDDILDLSKATADQLKIRPKEFSISELIEDVISQFALEAEQKGVRIVSDSVSPVVVIADMHRIQQILTNLISNAVKFTNHGEIRISAFIDGAQQKLLVIEIMDDGLGIAPDAQLKLFKSFYQVDDTITRRYGGSGIGLALSLKLAKLMGGDLTLKVSALSVGSTFRLELPCETTATAPDRPEPVVAKAGSLTGIKILVIDDNADNQFLISRYLTQAGATVAVADNGEAGFHKAQSEPFEILLMDIQMPVMGGLEATRALRTAGYTKPVIALSAHAGSEHQDRSLAAGCNAHITKPVVKTELISTILQFLKV